MGHAAIKHRRASYADLEAVPEGKVAELIDGQLYVFPRPAPPHLLTAAAVADEIRAPFHRGRGGPGGWWILPEPAIHFIDPAVPRGVHAVIGWAALGYGVEVSLRVTLDKDQPRAFDDFIDAARAIPEVLMSGDHARIAAWRRAERERLTAQRRPGLERKRSED